MKVGFRSFAPADLLTMKEALPFSASENQAGIVAYDIDTYETLAALVAQDWTQTACFVHQVILNPMVLRHGWFSEIGDWLFDRANRIVLYAGVLSNNERSLKFHSKIGFTEVCRLKDAYDYGVDMVILELRVETVNPKLWQRQTLKKVVNGTF